MADTWRQNAIVQAIQIIADKKIAQAGYDRTIKGVINKVIDKPTGKYQIRYQDTLFEAFATSAKIEYTKDQQVSVLIPGNDWDRVKTILGSVNTVATIYQQVPIAAQQYNSTGPNGVNFNQNEEIGLSSYYGEKGCQIILYSSNKEDNILNIRDDITNYIKKGDSISFGMTVRTALADSQIGGNYGVTFYLVFKDNITGAEKQPEPITVDISDVIGHPYQLISPTLVESLVKGVDTKNFVRVDSIQAFCIDFPGDDSKLTIEDIFISDIRINGAKVLTEEELNGSILHIDCSQKGNILKEGSETEQRISELPLTAILKINGKPTTQNVVYYWFRQNGTIFKGSTGKYSSYAGDGWECLNVYQGNSFVPKENGKFIFNSTGDDLDNSSALAPQRVTKVLCVAVHEGKSWKKGEIQIINNNRQDVKIISSDLIDNSNKVQYFLDNGSPTLTCKVYNKDWTQDKNSNYKYTWSFKPYRNSSEKIEPSSTVDFDPYEKALKDFQEQEDKVSKMAQSSAEVYVTESEYLDKKNNWENNYKDKQYVYKNIYYNFPIKKILNYGTVSCSVQKNNTYVGTGGITLYNKQVLEGTYSLNILNGVQIFQYDEKGNSPFVKQVDRPAIDQLKSLGFILLDNTGKQITYQQIINEENGYVKWLFPGYDTLLISKQGNADISYDSPIATADEKALSVGLYNIYNNKKTFSYSIEDKYKLSSVNNTIKLVVKFKDIILQSYTDFTFPKNGDPGTNGTDLVAKLTPASSNSEINSDRIYAHRINNNNQGFYTDSGSAIDRLKFFVYNNNRQVYDDSTGMFWSCPPKTVSKDKDKTDNNFISIGSSDGILSLKDTSPTSTVGFNSNKKPIHIARGKRTISNSGNYSVDYMAEYPICYVYTEKINDINYRIKIKPKTGFKYVVYQQDGTRPDYDSQPFELRVQKLIEGTYWTTDDVGTVTATWIPSSTSDIKVIPDNEKSYIATAIPSDTFNGQDLTCALIADVKVNNNSIGFIHIPIYRLINRYGNNAINGWDGNSIELGADTGTILAPQVGAGKKNNTSNDNTFTGVLMGQVKTGEKSQTGLFGYNNGQRSIFLDAQTGKAEFGKNNSAKIILDPSQQMSGKDTAFIYSNNFDKPKYKNNNGALKNNNGYINYEKESDKGGMMIDLTSPQIAFANGKFNVSSTGGLHSQAGDIAGWKISADALTSQDNNVYLRSQNYTNYPYAIYSNGTFTVTPGGYMTSTSGKIAKWSINANRLTDGKVGMGQMEQNDKIPANTFYNQSSQISNGRIWSNNNFVVDNNGKLWANNAQIGPWATTKERFTNGNVGLGILTFRYGTGNTHYNPFGEPIAARFWGASGELTISDNAVEDKSNTGIGSLNFAVSNQGKLYSKAGKIGGWNIESNKLYAVGTSGAGIRLNADGSMNGGKGYSASDNTSGSWTIATNGRASFTGITVNNMTAKTVDATDITCHILTANDRGTVGGWTIGPDSLTSDTGSMVINSSGSMSGPGWSITADGNASFANGSGSFSAGGGSSVNGGISCGSGGGGSWGGPGGISMEAKNITLYTRLGLKKTSFQGIGDGKAHIPAKMESIRNAVKIKKGSDTTVYGEISGSITIDGHSGSISNGRCWIDIPTYTLEYDDLVSVPTHVIDIGGIIVTGWNKTETTTANFLCSENPDQDFEDG